MKKLLALILALSVVLSAAAVFVSAEEIAEPDSYLWLKATGVNDPCINFKVPGSVLTDDNITIKALVRFGEDCVANDGCVYLNCYSYEQDEYNNWEYLISFIDYAKNTDAEPGKWAEVSYSFNPFDGAYGSHAGSKYTPAMLSMGVGFYLATGTISVADITVEQGGKKVWSIDFKDGLDFSKVVDGGLFNISAANKGVSWNAGKVGYTNIAAKKSYTVSGNVLRGDAYDDSKAGKLTDLVKGSGAPTQDTYFGLKCLVPEDTSITTLGIDVVIDLGEVKDFDKVTADVIFGKWGIDATSGVKVSASVDGETYSDPVEVLTSAAATLPGFDDGWTGLLYTASGSFHGRYVKVTYCRDRGAKDNHIWPSEIEVYGNGIPVVLEEEEEEVITAPDDYLTLISDGTNPAPGITFQLPASLVGTDELTVEALVYFSDDCSGTVFLNLYPYNEDTLLRWSDYAKATETGMGEWKKAVLKDWDPDKNGLEPDKYNLGIGFWMATGTIKVGYIKVIVDDNVVWSVTFDKFDLNDEYLINAANISEETRGVTWDITGEFIPKVEEEAMLGDFDGDGKVTSDDAVYLLRHTLFHDQYPVESFADFDGDDSITSDDAVYLLRNTLFPEQYPLTVKE